MHRILRRITIIIIATAVLFLLVVEWWRGFVHRQEPPNVSDAPWAIKTSSRIYYASELSMLPDGSPEIQGYWELDNGSYHYFDSVLPFPKDLFGKVDIIRRPRQ